VATNDYILLGGGEHARVVLDVLLSGGVKVHALFDPKYSDNLFGVPQLGEYKPTVFPGAKAIVAIGNNGTRKRVAEGCAHTFGLAVHPSAIVSPYSTVAIGSMIFQGTIIQASAAIGKHVIINTGAQVDHDCVVGDYAHLAPSVTLCGTVQVGEGALVGAGATVIPGIKIGKWSVIGAGAVVTKDVPDYAVVVGVPSKVIRIINPHAS
jgi:sugar O-acyltransferase (sialic acid O-acetyltransferase NeuD family)